MKDENFEKRLKNAREFLETRLSIIDKKIKQETVTSELDKLYLQSNNYDLSLKAFDKTIKSQNINAIKQSLNGIEKQYKDNSNTQAKKINAPNLAPMPKQSQTMQQLRAEENKFDIEEKKRLDAKSRSQATFYNEANLTGKPTTDERIKAAAARRAEKNQAIPKAKAVKATLTNETLLTPKREENSAISQPNISNEIKINHTQKGTAQVETIIQQKQVEVLDKKIAHNDVYLSQFKSWRAAVNALSENYPLTYQPTGLPS
jgi:hypothetical protein